MRSSLAITLWTLPLLACAAATPASSAADSAAAPAGTSGGSPPDRAAAPASPPPGEAGSTEAPTKPEEPTAITSVWLDLYNNCPTAMDYCVDDGNALYTSLSTSTTVTHSVRPGAKIRYRKGNDCTDTVFTVTNESEKQKANLCR
jgi:hypothetical protein